MAGNNPTVSAIRLDMDVLNNPIKKRFLAQLKTTNNIQNMLSGKETPFRFKNTNWMKVKIYYTNGDAEKQTGYINISQNIL